MGTTASKIPIQNIYYLLCYAWGNLEERDIVNVDAIPITKLVDLFAEVLINGITYLRKRGLDRGYIEFEEELTTLRGKIDFSRSLKRNLFKQARAHCEYDDFSYDVLHNRIIKSTIQHLIKIKGIDKKNKDSLVDILRWFSDIEPIHLNHSAFRRVQLNRNNAFYGFLLNVCELIVENMLVAKGSNGDTLFRDLFYEKGMPDLFEKFVLNFYKREQDVFKDVRAEDIHWYGVSFDEESRRKLPKMRTDISLTSTHRKIIIDTKYYSNPLTVYHDVERVHSNNLYQIFAYIKNVEHIDEANQHCEGILLYPVVDMEFKYQYELSGHPVRVCTIDLNQDWQDIHKDLLELIV